MFALPEIGAQDVTIYVWLPPKANKCFDPIRAPRSPVTLRAYSHSSCVAKHPVQMREASIRISNRFGDPSCGTGGMLIARDLARLRFRAETPFAFGC